jgi:hypothetical protein
MSCDEIRYWIREVIGLGWSPTTLARALGLPDRGALMSKLRRSWIFPGEQVRFTRQFDRIISGELVQATVNGKLAAVLSDNPVPLKRPARLVYNLKTGAISWVASRPTVEPVLPSFGAIMTTAVPIELIPWRE